MKRLPHILCACLAGMVGLAIGVRGEPETPAPGTADRILREALAEEDVHNCFEHIDRLRDMKAVPQLARMFMRDTDHACCVYVEILDALSECATPADIPVLIPLIDTETEFSGPVIRTLLAELADQPAGEEWSRAQWAKWWADKMKTSQQRPQGK
jgi:hypothetical protein